MRFAPSRSLIVVGAALALGIGGGIAIADVPAADGTITACMLKPGGTIRLIDAERGATCKKTEQKVEWNAAGQSGVSGYEVVHERDTITIESASTTIVHAAVTCPEGKVQTGGGASAEQFSVEAYDSEPFTQIVNNLPVAYGWTAQFVRIDGANFGAGFSFQYDIYVFCIDASS